MAGLQALLAEEVQRRHLLAVKMTKLFSVKLAELSLRGRGSLTSSGVKVTYCKLPSWSVELAEEWRSDEPETYFVYTHPTLPGVRLAAAPLLTPGRLAVAEQEAEAAARTALIARLDSLDATLVAALERGDVKVLRVEEVLKLSKVSSRQTLEAEAPGVFMTAEEAVALVRAGRRELAALSCTWCSAEHPDPGGMYLRAVHAAAQNLTQGPAGRRKFDGVRMRI